MHSEKSRIYSPNEIISAIKESDWPSIGYKRQEFNDHKKDWKEELGRELEWREFDELQDLLLSQQRPVVYSYMWRGREIVAIFGKQLKYEGKIMKCVALIFDVETSNRIGFWKIKHKTYFQRQQRFLVMQE